MRKIWIAVIFCCLTLVGWAAPRKSSQPPLGLSLSQKLRRWQNPPAAKNRQSWTLSSSPRLPKRIPQPEKSAESIQFVSSTPGGLDLVGRYGCGPLNFRIRQHLTGPARGPATSLSLGLKQRLTSGLQLVANSQYFPDADVHTYQAEFRVEW